MKQPRILILLDGSSSMLQPWSKDVSRFKTAGRIITTLMDSIYQLNDQVEFSLRVYGHQYPVQENNCFDTKNEVMFSKDNRAQMALRLASLHPMGVSPIAFSLKEAAETDLGDELHNAYSIILITDGGESCKGNICDVAKTLLEKKIYFKPYILSMVDYTPLKQEYDCLGSYLTVSKEPEISTAVQTIIESYRKALRMPDIITKELQVNKIQGPKATTVTRPPVVIKQEPVTPVKKDTPVVVVVTPPPPPSPVVLPKEPINPMMPLIVPRLYPVFYVTRSIEPVKVPGFKLKPAPEVIPSAPPVVAKKPTPTPVPKPVVTVKKPKPAANTSTTVVTMGTLKPSPYTIQTEDAQETTVEIYFTDGHGKFYSTTPQLSFVDVRTGKSVQKFYRTVDGAGRPDPQKVVAGTYDIASLGRAQLLMKNVPIIDKKKNKVIVPIVNGSLKFVYATNPDRPVKEYVAEVTKRFDGPAATIKQHCTSELEYAPGNYFIYVNMLPPFNHNADIEFGSETVIPIPEPGTVRFVNTNRLGKITLYSLLGDKYVRFYTMEITGNPEAQKLDLQPGLYEVHYVKHPEIPYSPEISVPFKVSSNNVVEVLLQ
ncbi:hypothetical protein ACTHGU_15630 [Chitinophagaceae bacterium MMS25-I14]